MMLSSLSRYRPTASSVAVTVLSAVCVALVSAVTLRAQAESAPPSNPGKKTRPVTVDAGSYTDNPVTGIRTLSDGVRITSDETVMKTALAQYNTRTDIAVAPGAIQINDERNTLFGNSGKAFYKTRDAVILGAVKIVVRPKPGSASAPEGSVRREFKDPVTIYCDRVDYNWRTRIAVATGNLTLKQNTSNGITRTATAKKLTFYSREERLTMEGDVNAVDSKGQKLKGPIATAIIREGAEEFQMPKGANFVVEVEDEDEPAAAAPTPLLPAPVAIPTATPTPPAPGTPPVPTPTPKVNPAP